MPLFTFCSRFVPCLFMICSPFVFCSRFVLLLFPEHYAMFTFCSRFVPYTFCPEEQRVNIGRTKNTPMRTPGRVKPFREETIPSGREWPRATRSQKGTRGHGLSGSTCVGLQTARQGVAQSGSQSAPVCGWFQAKFSYDLPFLLRRCPAPD